MAGTPRSASSRRAPAKKAVGAKAGTKPARRATRLSVDDWIDASFELMATDGVSGVKITKLCERLEVTKGSFYWHFADIDKLMEAIADKWCDTQNDTVRGLKGLETVEVEQRLQIMAELLIDQRTWAVESAVRDWARNYGKIADAVRELDNRIFEVVQRSLLDLDFDPDEARLRAGILVYSGIGFVHARGSLPTPSAAEVHAMFELLTRH
ncbi:TetR/AcrR family transcriptional regulator [Rhodococcus sp. 14-2483-1-1]|uniref:TetR/AcrR family transcriptional regulator n=1 Tax=Nocardiaceae TaxID=85025 RepID=UPI00055A887C|nr:MULTISPECIES: TetR/AcrR family transcriptional regulator [Rhodococcus]OZF40961.1 TetR/AcrR family transcriptional regulator [Rhodococcus sp. 14-2483-1-1]QII00403.1 TetR/AcrR family transcriptional regulator [Rhodococcus fascians A21d2]QII07179.1 TetR/AcrR family transcriptional regulator [Rhodococcus fascians A25f]